MSILEALARAAGVPVEKIIAWLEAGATALPDSAEDIAALIAKIRAPLTAEGIAALAGVVASEIKNIAQGRIEPKEHPSDLA